MAKILSFGAMNIDYVYEVEHFVRAGESLAVSSRSVYCGGKGLNQSVALARAGSEVYHAGVIGGDGGILLDTLRKNNVNTDAVRICDVPSGHAIVQLNPSGQNCILYDGGANRCVESEDIKNAVARFSPGDYIVLQNEINLLCEIIHASKAAGMRVVFNPSPVDSGLNRLPLEKVDLFVLNEVEAAEICGESKANAVMERLRQLYPESSFLLTLGSKGAWYLEHGKDKPLRHGIYKVTVADTTGAGDAFTGYFVASLAAGKPAEEALRLASVAASISVSRPGASFSIPYLNEVENSGLQLE